MKLEDLIRVENLEEYLSRIFNSRPNATELEKIENIAHIENLVRHVNLMANKGFLVMVEQKGFIGMLDAEVKADAWDELIGHPALLTFVQLLLILQAVTSSPASEAGEPDPADLSPQEPSQLEP